MDGPVEQGSFVVSAAFPSASCTSMSGGEVFLDTAVTANLARLHSYGTTRVLKNARYEAAVPYPTMARLMFGNGQIETVKHLVDVPTELAGKEGVLKTFLAEPSRRGFLAPSFK